MSDNDSGMFTESLRMHLEGGGEASRQTQYARRKRIYSRFNETLQKDMPLLLEAVDEGRLDVDDLVAELPTGVEGQRLYVILAELLFTLAEATDGVAPEEALDQAFNNRRAETAKDVFDRLMKNPQSTLRRGELRLLNEAGFVSDAARRTALFNKFETELTGEDLTEAMEEARSGG